MGPQIGIALDIIPEILALLRRGIVAIVLESPFAGTPSSGSAEILIGRYIDKTEVVGAVAIDIPDIVDVCTSFRTAIV